MSHLAGKKWEELTPAEQQEAREFWEKQMALYQQMSVQQSTAQPSAAKTVRTTVASSSAPEKPKPVVRRATTTPTIGETKAGKEEHKPKFLMAGAGHVWEDKTLEEWADNDYRLFVGNLGNDCGEPLLWATFKEYPSLLKVRVVRGVRGNTGYGFVSFGNAEDFLKALKEKDGKYCGSHPMVIKRSKWKDRILTKEALAQRPERALPAALPKKSDLTAKGKVKKYIRK